MRESAEVSVAIRHAQTAGVGGLWGRLMACRARFRPRIRAVSETILVSSGTVLIHTPGRENRGVARSMLISPVDKTGDKRTPPVEQATTSCWVSCLYMALHVGSSWNSYP